MILFARKPAILKIDGEQSNLPPFFVLEWLGSRRLETIADHLRKLESPLGVNPVEGAAPKDLKDRLRSRQSWNRDSPNATL